MGEPGGEEFGTPHGCVEPPALIIWHIPSRIMLGTRGTVSLLGHSCLETPTHHATPPVSKTTAFLMTAPQLSPAQGP